MINFIRNLAQKAGEIALTYFGKVKPVEKSDRSLVTEADLKLDKFIREEIKKAYPGHIILSEEMEKEKINKKSDILWAVDPLDGTAAFSSGLPVWGISIGVLINDIPSIGVVYLPLTKELYYSDGTYSYLWEQKIYSAKTVIDSNSFLAVPSNAHRDYNLKFFPGKTRSFGSIAAHLCYVAKGAAVGAVMKPHIWDIAGGDAIIRTSGGKIRYKDGCDINWKDLYSCKKTPQICIASNDYMFEDIKKLL